jgi:hypothetical protein
MHDNDGLAASRGEWTQSDSILVIVIWSLVINPLEL